MGGLRITFNDSVVLSPPPTQAGRRWPETHYSIANNKKECVIQIIHEN